MKLDQVHLVFGWDQPARQAVCRLLELGAEVIVIHTERPDGLAPAVQFINGSAADAEVLRRSGIERAHSVLVALPTEQACAALTQAKRLNPAARRLVSLRDPQAREALEMAGASLVIDAFEEAGREMVRRMLDETPKPAISEE